MENTVETVECRYLQFHRGSNRDGISTDLRMTFDHFWPKGICITEARISFPVNVILEHKGFGSLWQHQVTICLKNKMLQSSIYQTIQCSETNIAIGICDKVWQCFLSKKVSRELEEAVDIGLTCFWFLYYIATSLLQLRKTNKGLK